MEVGEASATQGLPRSHRPRRQARRLRLLPTHLWCRWFLRPFRARFETVAQAALQSVERLESALPIRVEVPGVARVPAAVAAVAAAALRRRP